jgi:hypothetical protein
MKTAIKRTYLGTVLMLAAGLVAFGCNQKTTDVTPQAKGKTETAQKAKDDGEDHGWWCTEHGIPEEICGLCNKSYRDKKKADGDWCETHRRLKSQCFKCDPALYEKDFEPLYVAKYGKKPERPPETEFTK